MQKLTLIFLLLSSTIRAQILEANIQNVKTSKHVNIARTRLYIIPPPGFAPAKTFNGFQNNKQSIIVVQDVIGGSFYKEAANFSGKQFELQGGLIFGDQEKIKVNGYAAKFVSMQSSETVKTLSLLFGDETFSTLIMAKIPVDDKQTEEQIIDALQSIFYDKDRKLDPFDNTFFTLDEKSSKFKFNQFQEGVYRYTVGGGDISSSDDPLALITTPAKGDLTPREIASRVIGQQQEKGFTIVQKGPGYSSENNGFSGYKIEVRGQMHEKETMLYIYVILKYEKVVCLSGITTNNFEENKKEFAQLAHSIAFPSNTTR